LPICTGVIDQRTSPSSVRWIEGEAGVEFSPHSQHDFLLSEIYKKRGGKMKKCSTLVFSFMDHPQKCWLNHDLRICCSSPCMRKSEHILLSFSFQSCPLKRLFRANKMIHCYFLMDQDSQRNI
jgi:hypothetical protein